MNNNRYGSGYNRQNPYLNNGNSDRNQFDSPLNVNRNQYPDNANQSPYDDQVNTNRNRFNNQNSGDNFQPPFDDPDNNFPSPFDIENERKIRFETEKLRQLLIEIDTKNSAECTLNVAAQWNFETSVNEVTQLEAVSIT